MVSLIYRTETLTEKIRKSKLKTKADVAQKNILFQVSTFEYYITYICLFAWV